MASWSVPLGPLWLCVLLVGPVVVPDVAADPYFVSHAAPNRLGPGQDLRVRGAAEGNTIWFQAATAAPAGLAVRSGSPEVRTVFQATADDALQVAHFMAPPGTTMRVSADASVWVGVLPHGRLEETDAGSLRVGCVDRYQAYLWETGGATGLSVRQPASMPRVRVVALPATMLWERWDADASGTVDLDGAGPLLVLVDEPETCAGEAVLSLRGPGLPLAVTTGGVVVGLLLVVAALGLSLWLWRRGVPNVPRRGARWGSACP